MIQTQQPERGAMYCRSTGQRLGPRQRINPTNGAPVAVAVFDDGTSLSLTGDTVVGRSPQQDARVSKGQAGAIIITSQAPHRISRCHLLLRVTHWDVEVIDLGSRNGTWLSSVDGDWARIVPGLGHNVGDGQAVRFGSRCFAMHYLQRNQRAQQVQN